jgi:hypothetical protein
MDISHANSGAPDRISLSDDDLRFLDEAVHYLERPSLLMRLADLVGMPAEKMLRLLPKQAHEMVGLVARSALERAFAVAVRTLGSGRWPKGDRWRPLAGPKLHVALAAVAGGAGGMFGWSGAAVEIPITTTLMLRSIAQIAQAEGADLADPATVMQCLAVFSYGAPKLEAMESAFFSWRLAMAGAITEAAAYVAVHGAAGAAHSTAPALVRLLGRIAARFQVVISDKLAAEAVRSLSPGDRSFAAPRLTSGKRGFPGEARGRPTRGARFAPGARKETADGPHVEPSAGRISSVITPLKKLRGKNPCGLSATSIRSESYLTKQHAGASKPPGPNRDRQNRPARSSTARGSG